MTDRERQKSFERVTSPHTGLGSGRRILSKDLINFLSNRVNIDIIFAGGIMNITTTEDHIGKNFKLPFPPLDEQQRIATRLNEGEEIKKTNAESDTKIEELQSSLLQRAFRGEL